MVNVPRALFKTRTGRQARYHIAIEETPEWAYLGEPLSPLKGFPGVVWDRSRRKPRVTPILATSAMVPPETARSDCETDG
jgi:hypothetical protein